jgi:Complex 1 protein (LYR family)
LSILPCIAIPSEFPEMKCRPTSSQKSDVLPSMTPLRSIAARCVCSINASLYRQSFQTSRCFSATTHRSHIDPTAKADAEKAQSEREVRQIDNLISIGREYLSAADHKKNSVKVILTIGTRSAEIDVTTSSAILTSTPWVSHWILVRGDSVRTEMWSGSCYIGIGRNRRCHSRRRTRRSRFQRRPASKIHLWRLVYPTPSRRAMNINFYTVSLVG